MTKKISPLHFRRLELKYLLPTSLVDLIIPTLANYLQPDDFANDEGYYTVNSLYYDSPDLHCYNQKLDGIYFRKKYRLRYYDYSQNTFLEIKRKAGDTVIKDRLLLDESPRELYNYVHLPHLLTVRKRDELAAELLTDTHHLHLKPKAFVKYRRRPFISRFSNSLRVTIDYDLRAAKFSRPDTLTKIQPSQYLFQDLATLEIKYNSNLPGWMDYVIKTHDLERISFSKYQSAIEKLTW